jgi:CBS domain containing-hemolysin-like protein
VQLIKLLDIQKAEHGVLTAMESRVLAGALNFKEKTVESVMSKIERVTMLNVSGKNESNFFSSKKHISAHFSNILFHFYELFSHPTRLNLRLWIFFSIIH